MHKLLRKLCIPFKKIINCVGPLILNQFDVTVLNKYSRNLCAAQRDAQALPFTLWKERTRRGGREREKESGRERNTKEREEEIDGVSRRNNSHQPSFIGKNRCNKTTVSDTQ